MEDLGKQTQTNPTLVSLKMDLEETPSLGEMEFPCMESGVGLL